LPGFLHVKKGGKYIMKRGLLLVVLFFSMAILSACANPHIGKSVNYRWNNVCRVKSFPSTCRLSLEHFDFDFEVEQQSDQDYVLTGEAYNTKSVGASRIYSGTFTFFLVNDSVITEAVTVVPRGNLAQSISFKKSFTPQESFDGILVGYSLTVK
jgi:hypothetical protein